MTNEPIAKKAYYSIGEVCDLTGLKPHVLRYWETQFDVLSPTKNRAGNRVFRPKEIELILLVKHLLYEEKYTIEGARQALARTEAGEDDGSAHELRATHHVVESLEVILVEYRDPRHVEDQTPGAHPLQVLQGAIEPSLLAREATELIERIGQRRMPLAA